MKFKVFLLLFLQCSQFVVLSQNPLVSEIKISGNKRTKTSFLERLAFVKVNSQLDSMRLASDVRRFKLLPSVASASYEVVPLGPGKYRVEYRVVENFAIIPGLNVSQDVNGDLAYRTSVFDFNFLGQNQIVGGFYRRNVFDSYGFFWEAPNLISRKWGIGVNYQNNVLQEPVFFQDNRDVNYKFDSRAFEFRTFYEHNFHNRFMLGLNYSRETYDFLNGDLTQDLPLELGLDRLAVIGSYEYNNITNEYQYVGGFRSIFTYSFTVGAQGDTHLLRSFFIGRNDFEYFKRFGQKGNWANRLRLGFATNDTSPFAPFALDNQLNIRGVGNVVDRGTASAVINTEYRYTFIEKGWFAMQGNVFVDAGTWQDPGGQLGDLIAFENSALFTGLGVRFIHRRIFNAVFRIDYGFSLTDKVNSGLVFGIGQYL
ncbi:hypothetical protein [Robiginitalea marina]|uniref:POTRA domain-containing protein n=1 Tax=Robiginitalea marina TaxID=2954105 RepID=A0ABT1AVP7_9FLAO|nr:hypothetical protein [Robiginitalea marina]MCO5724126.1 hypothetical protein [Robiginitalea marina]